MSVIALVDGLVQDRVLAFGSLPPAGRDLDLLVRPAEYEALCAGLSRRGFIRRGSHWARFAACSVEVIELVCAGDWGISNSQTAMLFEDGIALAGARHVVRPAPHHQLLIIARRVCAQGGSPTAKLRGRVDEAVRQDPGAWARSRACADEWRALRALTLLERSHQTGVAPSASERGQAVAEQQGALRRNARRRQRAASLVRNSGYRLLAPDRGAVVAFSGLDGSGKSTQAAAMTETLERLGYPTVVRWTSLPGHPWLEPVARTVRAVLRIGSGKSGAAPARASAGVDLLRDSRGETDPGRALRERSRLANLAWTLFVTLASVQWQWRATCGPLMRGQVVICDRYVLDSKVQLRYTYGEERRFPVHTALLRVLSPSPRRAYFLDTEPDVVSERNHDYAPAQVRRRARLYRDEYRRMGVRRVDGNRPVEEVCAEIAADVWMSLGHRRLRRCARIFGCLRARTGRPPHRSPA